MYICTKICCTRINDHQAVRECVVNCHELPDHDKILVGYWTPKPGAGMPWGESSLVPTCFAGVSDAPDLEQHLQADLPEYMIPKACHLCFAETWKGLQLERTHAHGDHRMRQCSRTCRQFNMTWAQSGLKLTFVRVLNRYAFIEIPADTGSRLWMSSMGSNQQMYEIPSHRCSPLRPDFANRCGSPQQSF